MRDHMLKFSVVIPTLNEGQRIRKCIAHVRAIDPDVTIEISGGITPENCVDYAPFADVISMGWLTHSVRSVDFSLNVA